MAFIVKQGLIGPLVAAGAGIAEIAKPRCAGPFAALYRQPRRFPVHKPRAETLRGAADEGRQLCQERGLSLRRHGPADGSGLLLARRRAQEKCMEDYVSRLVPGDVIDAAVTHMEGFGAFMDVGAGVTALLPVDNISVSRIAHPADRFAPGDLIKAVVRSRDERGRITLTHKELLGTWAENAAMIEAGETVTGIVRSIESYGVFVELFPNLAGLSERTEDYPVGTPVVVYIKNVNPGRMKVKLAIVGPGDPGEPPKEKLFFTGKHMDRFTYSPEESEKLVETIF